MDKKTKAIIGILVGLLLIAVVVIIILVATGKDKDDKPKKEPETKQVEKPSPRPPVIEKKGEEGTKEKAPEENKPKEEKKTNTKKYKIKKVLFDTKKYGNDDVEKVELTTDGIVLVSITGSEENDVTRQEVATKVVKTYMVQVGQADICEGNKRLMFIHKNGTASYLNIDELTCGQDILVQKLEGYKDIDKFEVETVKNDGEPDAHIAYVITKDGKKTDISDEIN